MSKEELQALAKKVREGKASEAEKLSFVKELSASLNKASEILSTAQKANKQ